MRTIKNIYSGVGIFTLMILRLFVSGNWFGSIVLWGLLIAWIDTIGKVLKECDSITHINERRKHAIVMIIMTLFGLVLLLLSIINLVNNISFINDPIFIDEVTLVTLLISLLQNSIIRFICNRIKTS